MLALASASACAPQQPRTPLTSDAVALLVDAQRGGIPIHDPSVTDADMRRAMDDEVGRRGSPRERIERLRRWLHDGDRAFVHDPSLTVDARTSFRERRGGCMAQ